MQTRFQLTALALAAALALPAAAQSNIGALNGTTYLSPFTNQTVAGITGIVTAVASNGFWMQDSGDGNDVTSDGIFVFRGSGSRPAVGDAVTVTGLVQNFRPGGNANNLTIPQINGTVAGSGFSVLSSGNALPQAVVIDVGGRLPPSPIAPSVVPGGNLENAGYTLQPTLYSADFYRSLMGMRVALPSAVAVGPNGSFGELPVVASAQFGAPGTIASARGSGVVIGLGQFNGQRIILDDRLVGTFTTPSVNGGAQIGNIVGVMDYSFSNYKLQLTQAPTVTQSPIAREQTTIASGRFGIASYNVENLAGSDADARFAAIATQIRANLGAPQLIALQEIQDNNGTTNNGTVAADMTLGRLKTQLDAQTGRNYQFVTVDPVNNADGGAPGGNIRQAFMYDASRVSFSGVVGGALTSISATGVDAGGRILFNLGAGRVDPGNTAFANSRKPLVTDFTVDGRQIIVIANHFNSKGGDQPLYGPAQPPARSSEVQRLAQAQALGSFVAGLLALNPNANIVLTGDLNDFQFADTLAPLAAAGLINLTNLLPENERYSYNFEGNLQVLDHMFVSPNLLANAGLAYDIVHANAEFFDQVSDHDPLLLTLGNVPVPVPEPGAWALMFAGLALVARRARRAGRMH
jgi:predicted extracellular nuclease